MFVPVGPASDAGEVCLSIGFIRVHVHEGTSQFDEPQYLVNTPPHRKARIDADVHVRPLGVLAGYRYRRNSVGIFVIYRLPTA